jgi:hypothetical protein
LVAFLVALGIAFFTFGFSLSGLCGVFNALLSAASKRAFASFSGYSSESFAMTDYTMKAEAGAYAISGGKTTLTVHVPLPPDHPMHALVGQVAAKWSQVEHFLDIAIWRLAKLDDKTGACLTGQIIGSYGRLTAIYALCVHRNLDPKIIKQLVELSKNMKGSQDRRNRILHDAWYVTGSDNQTQQFKSMAKDEFLFGFHPVDEDFITKTLEKRKNASSERANSLVRFLP